MNDSPVLRVGSLFSGIGGLDLGLERAGMKVIWQSEIDPYASRVLAKHWPAVPNLGNIKEIDWSEVEHPDVICGGYPCQPFSLAGGRKGTEDERHLWPYFADALRVLRPRFALMENVPGHLSMGFGDVLGDLASIGYDAEWECVSAESVGAPHLRWRVFIVAYPRSSRRREDTRSSHGNEVTYEGRPTSQTNVFDSHGQGGGTQALADAQGDSWGISDGDSQDDVSYAASNGRDERRDGDGKSSGCLSFAAGRSDLILPETSRRSLTESPSGNSEPGQWEVEPDVGRVAHGVPSRVDRLRCLGNAVVPQVAEFVGRRIMAAA